MLKVAKEDENEIQHKLVRQDSLASMRSVSVADQVPAEKQKKQTMIRDFLQLVSILQLIPILLALNVGLSIIPCKLTETSCHVKDENEWFEYMESGSSPTHLEIFFALHTFALFAIIFDPLKKMIEENLLALCKMKDADTTQVDDDQGKQEESSSCFKKCVSCLGKTGMNILLMIGVLFYGTALTTTLDYS